jgi:hypothetical protein
MAKRKAHLKLTAAQHRHLMKALKGGALGDIHDLEDFKLYVEPGDFGGDGLWSDLKSEVKKVQKNPIARKLEKKAVSYGAKALRGIAEGAADGIGDTAATFVGVPEIAAPLDAAIDRGLSSVQKAGTKYLDDKIDASGKGHSVRYMAPSGGGLRMSGVSTHSGGALRLAGQGHGKAHHCGCGIRMSGSGITASHHFPAYPLERGATP